MKKRILALALVLVMVCCLFTGCGESAYSMIQSAIKKTQALESVSVKMEMDMTITSEAMAVSMPIVLDMKGVDIKSDNPTILTNLTMSILGQSLDIEIYQEDGWSYVSMGELKQKTHSAPNMDQYDYSDEMMQVIPEELMKNVEMVKNPDGTATATITIPGEKFMEIYADMVDGLSQNLSDAEDLSVNDAVIVITVANGYVSCYDMAFSIEAVMEDDVATMEVKAVMTYDNPGQPVQITPPEGYQDYPAA